MFNTTTTFEEPSLNNLFEEEQLNASGWSTNIPDFFTELEFESLFYEKLFSFNKEGAKLVLTNISELGEKNMICLIQTENINKQGKQITIKSPLPVVLYDKTRYNLEMLKSQRKSTETLIECKVYISEAYTFTNEAEVKSNANLRTSIQLVNYDFMHKIYNELKAAYDDKEILSDEDCINEYIRYFNMHNKPIIIAESKSRTVRAFPKSNYTKEVKIYKYHISAKYIKDIQIIK